VARRRRTIVSGTLPTVCKQAHKPFTIINLVDLGWGDKARSLVISGGCAKVILLQERCNLTSMRRTILATG